MRVDAVQQRVRYQETYLTRFRRGRKRGGGVLGGGVGGPPAPEWRIRDYRDALLLRQRQHFLRRSTIGQ